MVALKKCALLFLGAALSRQAIAGPGSKAANTFTIDPVSSIFFTSIAETFTMAAGLEHYFYRRSLSLKLPLIFGYRDTKEGARYIAGWGLESRYFFKKRFSGYFASMEALYSRYKIDKLPLSDYMEDERFDHADVVILRPELGRMWMFSEFTFSASAGGMYLTHNSPYLDLGLSFFPTFRINAGFPFSSPGEGREE